MRVAVFHLGFFYSGGGEKLILEEIRGLKALGHHVDCFAPYVDRKDCYPDIPEMVEIHTFLPPPPQWLPMKDPLWVLLSCLFIPFLSLRFRSYDIFFGANQPGPWFAFVLSKILRKPYVIYLAQALRVLHPREVDTENGIRIREGDTRFINALTRVAGWIIDKADRISVRNAQVVLTNGGHVSRWIHEVYGVENRVCPAGCHPLPEQTLQYSNRWEGSLEVNSTTISKPYMLLTNRHAPMKRFEYAIWALRSIRKKAPALSLVITGQETEYTDQLRYLVDGMGLTNAVKFVGLVTEDELASLYREAALYVYPSPEEDFGMGIVEAMAAGTPVVAWNNGGPTVTVRDGETGFLVEPYDTIEFTERLLNLVLDPKLAERMGRAGHLRAVKLFSYERHNQILDETLREVFERYRQPSRIEEQAISIPTRTEEQVLEASELREK
jgi:glycosyltransferase involved in cell wall biosynthesis